jgi:hypothetical protein
LENKKLQTGGETTNTDSSNDFFNYVDNIFKTQILPKKDIEPALPKIEDLDIDLDLIKKVDEPDLGWKSAKEEFLTDTFEIGTSDEELKRIKNFDFSLRDGDNRYQRRYDNMNWGSNLLRTVGNYAATGMEIATGMAGGLWEGGEELVDEVSEQTGLDIYNNKEFGKNWLLSASDWLRESKPEIYDRDGVEQGEGNFWEQLKDIKSLDLGDIYKAGSVLPSVFGSMAVAIPLTAVIMPSSIAAGAAVGGVPGAVVGGFMGKTVVAAALAYAEGMMDAKDVYKEKYDEIFEKTMDVNYAENVAKTAANKNLLYNTALNTPLNLIEVGFLTKYLKKPAFKSFDTFNPDKLHGRYKPTLLAGETTEDYIARMARNEIRDSSGNVIGYKSNLNRSFTEFLKDIPDDIGYNIRNKKEFIGRHYDDILSPLSEGLEEYNNFWSREKGMENVDTKLSIAGMLSDGTSYLPEFAQNMKEGEGVFDILSGMLGAVVTNPIMTNVHIKRDKIYDPISNTYKFKYDRSDLNPFKETDFFQFGKKEADKKDMKSYIERSIDNIRTTKKLFSDFNNSPDIETKSHLLDQMMIQPITEAISSNTLNTKIATYQEGLNMLQEKRNEPLENKLDFLSTTDKTNVQNLMLKLSTASEQVEIDTINGQLDNYNKTANKHIELQSKTIKENIDYLNQLNTAYVSLYSQKQTENDYGYLNELFKAQFSYDQELKFRTKLERDLESRITELTSLAPNKNEALMSLENDTEFNQAQDNLLASEIRAMQFGARLNMLRRGEFLEDTHNILEQDLIDKIETYKIDSPEILAYKKYVRLKSLPERFQESIKGELKRMEENELKSFFEFKNNYNQLIELQNKKAKEDNESAIYKYIKRSQKVADLHHKLAKNKVEFDNFYKLIDSTSAYFKYFTEFGDFGYDELISNLTSQLAMKDWYSNYLTFYNAVIQDIELFEVNNPTLSSDYKGRIIHLKKQIKTNHLRITQFYIIQSTKFKKRNIIDDILGYLNSNQKPVSGKLPWNYEDLLNNIKSEFGITVDEDGTYQTNRVNYVIQYEDKFHIAKSESKKIEYDFNTNSFISVEYINEFKRNDPKLIVISKRTTPLNYNDDYIDLSSGTLLKDFLKENGLTLTLVNEYNIDVVNGVNLNIFTEDKDNKKRQLIFIKEALASKDKSPDISKLSNDSKDIYNKIKKALEDTTNSLVLSDSGNTPIDRNNLDNIIEIMQNDLTLEIINERFTEEEIKDMMEGKDEAIENIIKVLTDGELPDTKNLREIYNKYFKEIDGIKSAFIDDDEYDIKESYNKWGGILITHIFKSIESMDLKSKIDIAHRLRKSIGSENADSVKDLHYQLFFYYIGDEKILSEIKDELIHNINDMKKSVFEIEPELIDGDYDKIINGNEKEVEGLIESYQGFYKAIKFINKLRQIEGELFSDFDRIIDEENQIFNDKDKTLLKARFNKDKLNEYYDNWINSLGIRVISEDIVEDVKDLTDRQKNIINLQRANKIASIIGFRFKINGKEYDSIEELFKYDSSYINLNPVIHVLNEKGDVIEDISLTINNKLIEDVLLDDDILIRKMMSERREEVLKLLTNTSSTDPIKYNFNKIVKLIEFEYLFGIFEIDDVDYYDTYNRVVLKLNELKIVENIVFDTTTDVPSFKFNVGTKNEKNYIGLTIPEDVEIFPLAQLKDAELKEAFYENYKHEDKYYYDEKTNKLTFKNKNDFNKVRAGYYTEDDGTNSEFPYAKTRKIFPSVIDWALYKKNPLLYLKHKKRGINLDGETNLINSTSLKFNTDAYKNKLIKSFQLLKSTPKIFEFTYKDSTETKIRIRIEKSENGEFTVITDLDEKSGLSRHESLKVDGTYTFYLDDNKENMLFQIIENTVETSYFKYENAKRVLDIYLEKMMTDTEMVDIYKTEELIEVSRFYSDIDVTTHDKYLFFMRELRNNLFLLGNPIVRDVIKHNFPLYDSIYKDSKGNEIEFEFDDIELNVEESFFNNLSDFKSIRFFMLSDIPSIERFIRISKKKYGDESSDIPRFNGYLSMIKAPNSNYLLWLKQYFYYLHKYNPNKQREIQVGNKLYKLNGLVRLRDSRNFVHITDISNENGITKFNNVVFDSDLHEAEVFSENDNELIKGDKIYIFKNNEWRIKSEGDIEEIDEDLRNLLEDFRNKEIININNKDKNADLLDNNSVRFVNIINNRLRNDNEKLLINKTLIENEIDNEVFKSIIQNNKQDILNFVFRKSDSKFDDSDVHIQVPDEDLSNKIKKDALSEENYDALAYVLTNEGKLIPQNGGIVENDFRSFEVDANKINTDIKAFFNGEILNFKENGKAIIEVRSVKVTTKFEEISIGDNNSLELLVTSNAVELFILINHYLDPKGELDLLNNLNEKDVNELKTKANIYARIRILLDGVGIDQPIEKYIKDNFEDIHTLYKNVIQVVQIETDEVETDKSVHLGYLHDLTHYFKSNDIEKAYSMIVNYYNKVLSKFIKNDFQLKFKVRIENEGYLIASDKEDSFLVNYPKITKVYRFKGHGKDVKLHEFDVKNGKFKQVLLDVFEEKELKAIITEFLLIEDSNTDKVPDKEDLILMIETYLKNKDTINTAFFTILDNQFSFNKRILKLNNNKWDSIKENDKNLYQHYFDLFLGTLQKGTTNENIKSIIDNLFILYKDYGVSESEYANDKSKKKIELLLSKIDNESYYKNIVLPIYVVKNGNDFVFKLIGKIGNMIHVLELTRNGGHITYKMLKYDIGTEKLAENIQDDLAKTTPLDKDGYIAWLELMFPYIPIDIDMASFNKVDFGGSEIERFKLSYFTNTKSIEGNNFTNPLVKLDLREVEPYKTKSDKVDSAKIIDENITTKNLNLRTSLTELSSNTKGFSKGDVDSVILKILNVTSTQNEEAFNLILNEFKPLQVILQDFEDKIKITSISQTTFINNFKEFFKKNRGNINQFLIEKSNGDDSNNIESCI